MQHIKDRHKTAEFTIKQDTLNRKKLAKWLQSITLFTNCNRLPSTNSSKLLADIMTNSMNRQHEKFSRLMQLSKEREWLAWNYTADMNNWAFSFKKNQIYGHHIETRTEMVQLKSHWWGWMRWDWRQCGTLRFHWTRQMSSCRSVFRRRRKSNFRSA